MNANPMSPETTNDYHYWAFLSYSHNDRIFAAAFHDAIESYKLPAGVRPTYFPSHVSAPKYLRPVFRDERDMAAASSLPVKIIEALEQSRYLIVLCSQKAASSKWVEQEIDYFIKLGRRGSILAVVIKDHPTGNYPDALYTPDQIPILDKEEAYLNLGMPYFVEARGWPKEHKEAKLRVIAGLLSVGLDTLVCRDIQRRNRHLVRISIATVVTAVLFFGLAIYSYIERREAIQQKSKAIASRRQVEGILGDLTNDIACEEVAGDKPDTIAARQKRINDYYEQLDPADNDNSEISHRAIAKVNRIPVLIAEGKAPEALADAKECLSLLQPLYRAEPTNPEFLTGITACQEDVGLAQLNLGDFEDSTKSLREALVTSNSPILANLRNSGTLYIRGTIYADLGLSLLNEGKVEDSIAVLQSSSLKATSPSLSNNSCGSSERLNEAIAQLGVMSTFNLAEAYIQRRDYPKAMEQFRDGLQLAKKWQTIDPSRPLWQELIASTYLRIAVMQDARGRSDSPSWYRKSYEIFMQMDRAGTLQPTLKSQLTDIKTCADSSAGTCRDTPDADSFSSYLEYLLRLRQNRSAQKVISH